MNKIVARRKVSADCCADFSHLHPVLARIYQARGLSEHHELERDLKALLSYDSLLGIDKTVDLLSAAIAQQKKMMIIGDYDADGATSTALAIHALKAFGALQVEYMVPNRFEYGYGLSPEIVRFAAQKQPDVIITVDNGISSIEGVNLAKEMGIEVLITDHHLPGKILPCADAIVNPNQPNDLFASKHLAGVGVIFYIMLALRAKLKKDHWFTQQSILEPNMANLLGLVALGTIADVAALDKNNRILVYQGLQRIRAGKCTAGIRALIEVSGISLSKVTARDLGFSLGPRLNAAGRLEDMSLGIECLLCEDVGKAKELAQNLHELNQERRVIEEGMKQEAFKYLKDIHVGKNKPFAITLFQEDWHQGVIGILASRIKDKVHRPTIIFALDHNGILKGSARSIPGLHIRDILEYIATQNPELIQKFGGHAMAAGLSIARDKFEEFKDFFNQTVGKHLSPEDLEEKLWTDGELTEKDCNLILAEAIQAAEPWGQAFPAPLFDGEFQVVDQRIVGEKHLKLTLKKETILIDAIAFFVDTNVWPQTRCDRIHIVYKLDINEYLGNRKMQFIIEYMEPVFESVSA